MTATLTASAPESAAAKAGLSPLQQTVTTTLTDYWNDSCSIEELTYGISHGAVGATTNPSDRARRC